MLYQKRWFRNTFAEPPFCEIRWVEVDSPVYPIDRAVRTALHSTNVDFREARIPEARFPRIIIAGNRVSEHGQNGQPPPPVKEVLCSALVYTPLARLHRTNSPATRLQQPVAPRNKSSQHTLPYTRVAGRICSIYASRTLL